MPVFCASSGTASDIVAHKSLARETVMPLVLTLCSYRGVVRRDGLFVDWSVTSISDRFVGCLESQRFHRRFAE